MPQIVVTLVVVTTTVTATAVISGDTGSIARTTSTSRASEVYDS